MQIKQENTGIETPDLKHFSFCYPYSVGDNACIVWFIGVQ